MPAAVDAVETQRTAEPQRIEPSGPATLAGYPTDAFYGLTTDRTHVYWAVDPTHAVARVPRLGGAVQQVAQLELRPTELAVEGESLYVTVASDDGAQGALLAMPRDGTGRARTIAGGLRLPWLVQVAGDSAFVTVSSGPPPQAGRSPLQVIGDIKRSRSALLEIPLGGGKPVQLAEAPFLFRGGAVADGFVWWIAAVPFERSQIMRRAVRGGTLERWGDDPRGPRVDAVYMCVAGGHAWVTHDDSTKPSTGGVFRITKGETVQVARDQPGPGQVACDQQHVYWVNRGTLERRFADGAVMRVAVTGGEPEVFAGGQQQPSSIVVDEENVYWVLRGDNLGPHRDRPTKLLALPKRTRTSTVSP